MFRLSFLLTSAAYSATMGVSSTTPAPAPSSSPMVSLYGCPAHTPPHRTARLNACYVPSTNNIVRSLLFQASLPNTFWVEALNTATHLINRHPTKTIKHHTPHFTLYGSHPSYDHLRVFGCKCYPNLSATAPHKLSPRPTMCVFLGYPTHHKGYRCYDLVTNRVIISRHVMFHEHSFPFADISSNNNASDLEFLEDFTAPVQLPISRRLLGTPPTTGSATSAAGPTTPAGRPTSPGAGPASPPQHSPGPLPSPPSAYSTGPTRTAPISTRLSPSSSGQV